MPIPPRSLLLSLLTLVHLRGSAGDCVMTQTCIGVGCHPNATALRPPVPQPQPPRGVPIVCPQYAAASCCNEVQNLALFVNFAQLDAQFGKEAAGGCPACAQNLRDLFCAYTCSPRQSEFLLPLGITGIVNPTSGVNTTVLESRVNISSAYACAVYRSCSATKTVKTFTAMSSCEGMLNYVGGTGGIPQGAFLTFDFSGSLAPPTPPVPGALVLDTNNCCSFPANMSAPSAGNISCPCASCAGCCAGGSCGDGLAPASAASGGGRLANVSLVGLGDSGLTAAAGFQAAAVGGLYAGLALFGAAIVAQRAGVFGKGRVRGEEGAA